MGFRARKSINLGGGFRVNLSKNGVGYSWGVKGARITKTARGNTRTTFSIPGTGISYVNEVRKKTENEELHNLEEVDLYEGAVQSQSTENINVLNYQPAEYKELLDSLRRIQNINLLSTILIGTFILAISPIFIITGIAGLILKIYVHLKLPITMEYKFDEEAKHSYDNLCEIWMGLNENNRFWQTISESQLNERVSGGASRGVDRISSEAITKMPFFIKANVKPFGLKLRKQKLFFLPDKLLIISGRKVGALNYSDIHMGLGTTNFIETDSVPGDARILGYTWLKVNKNGSPDKRFKENRQVPVCEYGAVHIKSEDTLQVELMCSNSDTIKKMESFALKVFAS
ncbi:DUF4236 domain-containing protein [Listeria seeligeri]|nr:DUF4236 domain-containing protein [Listeria seeligeri]KKD44836.1 membrane protein [Listeria seeligeri]MBC1578278.1 DUF4236 domain-containing protein [Listeria seeligeri]MBC1593348.1 DUF4236 domain-containing protein [Listeria seeligeri]MBC1932879.1 DUF4236 domain-containing protein [Listeria seeligeri]MBC1989764.1 DUF4236 domain-containing protein [Listeria seeligeri]